MNTSIVVTGDRPTGQLHLGHYVGSLTQRLSLQNTHQMFILIADTQVLNNDISKTQNIKFNILSLMRDYVAIGLNPNNIHFVLQSQVPALFEATHYLSNLVSLPTIMRNPTIKSENALYNKTINMGFLNYPISQTADIILFNGTLVPIGADQLPIIEFANDLIDKFHHSFNCNIFNKITPLLSNTSRLAGIDGVQKMSKSLNNAIFLSDNENTLKSKIKQMYTDSKHLRINDPGQVEGNIVFLFLDVFMCNRTELEILKSNYRMGGISDSYLKNILFEEINFILNPIRDKYHDLSDNYLKEILLHGTDYARKFSVNRLQEIKDIIFK
jgi:tryptophanyl-tRNA synthetase